jgi:molybdate transport system substrate-binding protein
MRRQISAIAFGLVVAALGCGPRQTVSTAQSVRVAAASDLQYALGEIAAQFQQRNHDVTVSVTYGSSGAFSAQIANGAPYDVFLSADIAYPRQLAARGLAAPEAEFVYAIGRLVVWAPSSSSIDVSANGLQALADRRVLHVAIANPEHAPYGVAAEQAMQSAGVLAAVKPKLVLGENVLQALQFVQSGSADAGVIALSLALAPAVAGTGRYSIVPIDSYTRIEQGGTILNRALHPDAARAFCASLQSAAGHEVLKRYGFFLPGE